MTINYEDKLKIIHEANKMAIKSFKNFFRLLDLDPTLFSHLSRVKLKLGTNPYYASGAYDAHRNTIIIDHVYIENQIKSIMENPNDKEIKNSIMSDIIISIIHEMIHATRSVIIENGANTKTIKKKLNERTQQYYQLKNGHDLILYQSLLKEMIEKKYDEKFKKYIPIKVTFNNDGTYTVIAYDQRNDIFVEYANQTFRVKYDGNIDNFYYQIGLQLNNNRKSHKPTSDISLFTNSKKKPFVVTAADYYHPYPMKNHALDRYNIPILNPEIIDNKIIRKNYDTRVENSSDFEESMVETLANIIFQARNDLKLDLDNVTSKLIHSHNSFPDVIITANFIKKMGIDIIKWFLLATYNDSYEDQLEKIFQEKYDSLLHSFSNIYQASVDFKEVSEDDIKNINKIVEGKNNRRK